MNVSDRVRMLETAHQAADRAGAVILPHFRQSEPVDNKASGDAFDPVTAADRAAEQEIRALIETHWPEHGLIGEEYRAVRPDAAVQWIIDPIDGTRSFISGSPLWGTLIGVVCEGTPILGLMDQPFTAERFYASDEGAFRRGPDLDAPRQITTRACAGLGEATIVTTHPELFASEADRESFLRLESQVRMSRYGGDCYGYAMLAAGFVDLVVESGLNAYDIAPLIPIIEQAGGRITTWEGAPAAQGGRIIAAGDPKIHEAAMAILNYSPA